MLLLASALAAPPPSALSTYKDEVALATEHVRNATPRIGKCPRPEALRLLAQVELGTGEVTLVAISVAGSVKVASPCIASELTKLFTRHRPKVGREADLVFALDGGFALEGDVALLGDLPATEVEAGIRTRLDRIATCYVAALPDHPGMRGRVEVNITVLPDGRVGRAEVGRSELFNPIVERCVLDEVGAITFAPPSDGAFAHVTYPFTFEPPG